MRRIITFPNVTTTAVNESYWRTPLVGFLGMMVVALVTTGCEVDEEIAVNQATTSEQIEAHLEALDYDVELEGEPDNPFWVTTFEIAVPGGFWQPDTTTENGCSVPSQATLKLSNEFGGALVLRDDVGVPSEATLEFDADGSTIVEDNCRLLVTATGNPQELTPVLLFGNDQLDGRLSGAEFFSGQAQGEPMPVVLTETQIVAPSPLAGSGVDSGDTASSQQAASAQTEQASPAPKEPPAAAPTEPPTTPTPQATQPPTTLAPAPPAPSYANCSEVRAAGKAPIRVGDPGFEPKFDRDGDGVGCET